MPYTKRPHKLIGRGLWFRITIWSLVLLVPHGSLGQTPEEVLEFFGVARERIDLDPGKVFTELSGWLDEWDERSVPEEDTAQLLYWLSFSAFRSDRLQAAMRYAMRAKAVAEQLDNPVLLMKTNRIIANGLSMFGDYEEALRLNQETLLLAQKVGDAFLEYQAFHDSGVIYWSMKDFQATVQNLQIALGKKPVDIPHDFGDFNNLGLAYLEVGNIERAMDLFEKALKLVEGNDQNYQKALVLSNFGDLFQRQGKIEEALRYLHEALTIARALKNTWIIGRSLRHQARALAQINRLPEAIAKVLEAKDLLQAQQLLSEQLDTLRLLIELYARIGNFEAAYNAQRDYSNLKEEILNQRVLNRAVLHQVELQALEKERTIAELKAERAAQEIQNHAMRRNEIESSWQRLLLVLALFVVVFFALGLYHRFREQRATAAKLSQLNQEKNEFIGIAAHDLRNPIGAQHSIATLLLEDWPDVDPKEGKEMLGQIADSSQRMLQIVSNLLDTHRIEAEGIRPQWEFIEADEILHNVSRLYAKASASKDQHIFVEAGDGPCKVRADKFLLGQVLDNLVSNAVKYSPCGKSIFLKVESAGSDRSRLIVQDEGSGISREERPQLFQKFGRLSNQPTGGESSVGLGLSVAKRMVEAMEGTLTYEEIPGKGATFVVELYSA